MLLLTAETRANLERWVRDGYPRETCGVLVGRAEGALRRVLGAVRARNLDVARDGDRYELDPGDLVAADADARARGLALLGIWHSHPDRPALPSDADRATAWRSWSYLILSVRAEGVVGVRSWRLAGDRFREEGLATASAGDLRDAAAPRRK